MVDCKTLMETFNMVGCLTVVIAYCHHEVFFFISHVLDSFVFRSLQEFLYGRVHHIELYILALSIGVL